MEFPQSRVRAGVARGDVTPPVGIYHRMWGAATHDQATGVHRPLTATALYLAPARAGAETAKLIIAVDHCLLWNAEMNALLETVRRKAQMSSGDVLVCFSHTHAAGLMGLERRELPGGDLIPQYLELLSDTLGDLAAQAHANQQWATIVYGSGECDLAANRDYYDVERQHFVCGFNPDGRADHRVVVARITSEEDETLATLVNYACHPTTLAWENTLISPDFPGAMREVIEGAIDAPCIFLQGASGDIGPREGYVGDTAVADQNGRRLGYAALAALEGLPAPGHRYVYSGPVVSGATLGIWRYEPIAEERLADLELWRDANVKLRLKYREDIPDQATLECDRARWQAAEQAAIMADDQQRAQDARAMSERATRRLVRYGELPRGNSIPYEAHVWRMGDAIWIALNGEHYNVLQRKLRANFPNTPLIITTLVNGSRVWYLPDAASYGKGLYQEEASILAAGSLERLINAVQRSIKKLLIPS